MHGPTARLICSRTLDCKKPRPTQPSDFSVLMTAAHDAIKQYFASLISMFAV